MTAIDELLYLHPAGVVSRVAAESPQPRRKRAEKPKHAAPERRLLLRLAGWGGARKGDKRAGPRQYEWYGEGQRAPSPAASVVRLAKDGLGPAEPAGQAAS